MAGWDGAEDPPHLLVNGDTTGPPIELASGTRIVCVSSTLARPHNSIYSLKRDTTLMTWRARAKVGAELPRLQATERAALQRLDVGETADVEFTPPGPACTRLLLAWLGNDLPMCAASWSNIW